MAAFYFTTFSPSSTYAGLIFSCVLGFYFGLIGKSKNFLKEFIFLTILFMVFVSAILNQIEISTFIKSIKIYIYPIITSLILTNIDTSGVERGNFNFKNLRHIFVIYLIAYIYLYISSNFSQRPDFLYENNFESFFFNILFFLLVAKGNKPRIFDYLIYLAVVISSLSISGILMSFFVLYFALHETKVVKPLFRVVISFGLGIGGLVTVLGLGYSRGYSLDELIAIDRVFFYFIGFKEIISVDFHQVMFGRLIFGQEISAMSCSRLSFYVSQIGVCDSAIFHSSIIRSLIDYGIAGLIFWMYLLTVVSSKIVGNWLGRGCFLLAMTANAISLSGSGSEVFLWPFVLFFLLSGYTREGRD